jgi:hypothetical protein
MAEVHINADIHCDRPSWVFADNNKKYQTPIYRIYVGDDLITERTWIWDQKTIIAESIWVSVQPHTDYVIRVEPILVNSAQAKFQLLNFKVVNSKYNLIRINNEQISFKIQ